MLRARVRAQASHRQIQMRSSPVGTNIRAQARVGINKLFNSYLLTY